MKFLVNLVRNPITSYCHRSPFTGLKAVQYIFRPTDGSPLVYNNITHQNGHNSVKASEEQT